MLRRINLLLVTHLHMTPAQRSEHSEMLNFFTWVGPYDFHDAENADGISESSHKNGIYSLMRNVTEFVKVWMN